MLKTQTLTHIGGRRTLRALGIMGAIFVLSRAEMMLGLMPFALGLFAAGLVSGENALALLLGCVLGTLRFPIETIDLSLPLGCALIIAIVLVADKLPWIRKLSVTSLAPLLAGTAALIPGLIKAEFSGFQTILAVLNVGIAAMSARVFQMVLAWRPERTRMFVEARAPTAFLIFALLMGLGRIWPPAAFFFAGFVVLVAGNASPGLGAIAGALSGAALLAGGANTILFVSLSAGGAVSGLLAEKGRHWAAPGFVLAAGLAGMYALEAFPGPFAPALAAALYLAVPEGWLNWLNAQVLTVDEPGRALREEAGRALRNLGAAFGELAAGVDNVRTVPDEQAVFADLREQLCEDCGGYEDCWAGEDDRAVRLLCRMISDSAQFGEARAGNDEIPPDVMRVCRRGELLPGLIDEEVRALRRKRGEEGVHATGLFAQAEHILMDMADRQERPKNARRQLNIRWGASTRSMEPGSPSGDAHVVRMLPDGKMLLLLSDGMGSGEAARDESERAVRLMWRFLSARVEPEIAFQVTNEMMLLRADGDMYATVDMCLLDLEKKQAIFFKLAASRSLIVRGSELLSIEGGGLPLGVLEGVTPSLSEVALCPGDVILMGTDGVMDLPEEGWIEGALLGNTTLMPNELSEAILRAAEEGLDAGGRTDDMTAVCVRVARNRDPPSP